MTNKQTINKSIETVFDFVREIIDNPVIVKQLPDKFDMDDQKQIIATIRKNIRTKKQPLKSAVQK